jgi:thiamine kinase-like enzyme
VVMSRLPGVPMRGVVLDDNQVKALGEAVRTLHAAVPPDVLSKVPLRPGRRENLIASIHAWAPLSRGRLSCDLLGVVDRGLKWLGQSRMEREGELKVPLVLGAGDGNLANYLWDGSRVRIVDFEDSGLSDRAFELAEITEHVGSWVEQPLNVTSFLAQFDLTAAESAQLVECRRLLALVWLFLLIFDRTRQNPRNPPGTVERQVDRLFVLLDE